jgi:chorismate-pyruvate lyase
MNSSITPFGIEVIRPKTDGLIRPLDYFYGRAGLSLPDFRVLTGAEVPEPFRRLLVHEQDMTPTLEEYYGDDIELRVLGRRRRGQEYWREVVLLLRESGHPVEFGAIRVLLDRFPEEARRVILEERTPLGHIMRDFRVIHTCQPNAFLELSADALIGATLQLSGRPEVYGRHNRLYGPDGLLLSEVVEILRPPSSIE